MTWDSVSNFFHSLPTALTHPNGTDVLGPSLSQALGPHGSRDFLRKGEIAWTLTGNWQKSSLGKRGLPELLKCACGQPGRGNYSPDPCRISSNPHLGSAVFPQAKFSLRANGPRRGRLSTTGEHQTLVWYARLLGRVTLHMEGVPGHPGKSQPWKWKLDQRRKPKTKKAHQKIIAGPIIYSTLATGIKLFLINTAN